MNPEPQVDVPPRDLLPFYSRRATPMPKTACARQVATSERTTMPVRPGCKCRLCYGAAEYFTEKLGHDHGLPAAEGCDTTAVLRVLTTGPMPDNLVQLRTDTQVCAGTMTCECDRCAADRSARVRRGVRRSQPLPIKQRKAA